MPEILVNDRPYPSPASGVKTVAELATEVCQAETASPRMVVSLRCDGQDVENERIEKVLASAVEQYQKIEMLTQPIKAVVKATLDQAVNLLEEATTTRRRAADLLDAGQQEEALQSLQRFFEHWRQIQETMLLCARSLEIDLATVRVNNRSFLEVFEPIRDSLTALRDGMLNRDFVVVCDTLRYELEEPLSNWAAMLSYLRDQTK
ncbi:MAG: hypothetical protein KA354_16610 [Phycisphaerae bacterium]|nr:hypothetical protein [Phycisphaerae bacterium]